MRLFKGEKVDPKVIEAGIDHVVKKQLDLGIDCIGDGEFWKVRNFAYFQAPFKAGGTWETIRIEFGSLEQRNTSGGVAWTGADLLMLTFEIARPGGRFGWLEIDNVGFFR